MNEIFASVNSSCHLLSPQFGNTALHEAAWNGNNDIVKILLSSYCFVDSINYTGFTPLHLAGQNGHAKVAKTLLKWKADPSLLNQVSVSVCVGERERGRKRVCERVVDPVCMQANLRESEEQCGFVQAISKVLMNECSHGGENGSGWTNKAGKISRFLWPIRGQFHHYLKVK